MLGSRFTQEIIQILTRQSEENYTNSPFTKKMTKIYDLDNWIILKRVANLYVNKSINNENETY